MDLCVDWSLIFQWVEIWFLNMKKIHKFCSPIKPFCQWSCMAIMGLFELTYRCHGVPGSSVDRPLDQVEVWGSKPPLGPWCWGSDPTLPALSKGHCACGDYSTGKTVALNFPERDKYDLLDLLTCRVPGQFLVCDTSAAFSIYDANLLQHFLSCASSVITARSLLECSLIGCWISARSLLNTIGKVVFGGPLSLLPLGIK